VMHRLLVSVLLVFSSASGCASVEMRETLEVQGMNILLNTRECSVKLEAQELSIGTGASCFFIKENNTNKVRTKYYKDIDSYVALIVGDTLPKNPEYPLTMQRNDCGSTVKALIISKDGISMAKKKFTNTVTCAGVGSDEKEFYILSH